MKSPDITRKLVSCSGASEVSVRINADFSHRAMITPDQYRWVSSPQRGVERVVLDRLGAEKARATTIVRYTPASFFPAHEHPGGEEILVLAGIFSDDRGDYPVGWYLRNPPGSSHQRSSAGGAIISVKLRQMLPSAIRDVHIDTRDAAMWQHQPGRSTCQLYSDGTEQVALYRLTAGEGVSTEACMREQVMAELFVVAGELQMEGRSFVRGSWIRFPVGDNPPIIAGEHGAKLYLKHYTLVDIDQEA